jgi:hypothetical protein
VGTVGAGLAARGKLIVVGAPAGTAGAFMMPAPIGRATAATAATARAAFFAIQSERGTVDYNCFNSSLELGARHSGHARERQFVVNLTDVDYRFGIDLRTTGGPDHFLVAGTFPLRHRLRPDPPHPARMHPSRP